MTSETASSSNQLCPDLPICKTIKRPTDGRELHACMGMNSCKLNDIFGDNDCAGQGYCATAFPHVCKTLNECKGQGGCGLFGASEGQCLPGQNTCQYQGYCGTPIQAERFSTNGPNAKLGVWVLARKRFEVKMSKAKKSFGDSPCQYGPPQQWLEQVYRQNGTSYDSCGAAGDKRCSFGYNNADDNTRIMWKQSEQRIDTTVKNCACDKGENE